MNPHFYAIMAGGFAMLMLFSRSSALALLFAAVAAISLGLYPLALSQAGIRISHTKAEVQHTLARAPGRQADRYVPVPGPAQHVWPSDLPVGVTKWEWGK